MMTFMEFVKHRIMFPVYAKDIIEINNVCSKDFIWLNTEENIALVQSKYKLSKLKVMYMRYKGKYKKADKYFKVDNNVIKSFQEEKLVDNINIDKVIDVMMNIKHHVIDDIKAKYDIYLLKMKERNELKDSIKKNLVLFDKEHGLKPLVDRINFMKKSSLDCIYIKNGLYYKYNYITREMENISEWYILNALDIDKYIDILLSNYSEYDMYKLSCEGVRE